VKIAPGKHFLEDQWKTEPSVLKRYKIIIIFLVKESASITIKHYVKRRTVLTFWKRQWTFKLSGWHIQMQGRTLFV
jgi:hypothetical protein